MKNKFLSLVLVAALSMIFSVKAHAEYSLYDNTTYKGEAVNLAVKNGPAVSFSYDTGTLDFGTQTGTQTLTGNFTATNVTATKSIVVGQVALTPGTTVALDNTLGDNFTLVPAQAETINVAAPTAGDNFDIVITTSGTSAFVLTFGTNFKTTGTLSTGTTSGKVFVISFVCDGTNCNERSRTTAM